MGQPAIVDKLNRELGEAITTEPQVYVLVEIRKLIQLLGLEVDYATTWTYASWAVHPVLKGPHGQAIVREIDRSLFEIQNNFDGRKYTEQEWRNLLESFNYDDIHPLSGRATGVL